MDRPRVAEVDALCGDGLGDRVSEPVRAAVERRFFSRPRLGAGDGVCAELAQVNFLIVGRSLRNGGVEPPGGVEGACRGSIMPSGGPSQVGRLLVILGVKERRDDEFVAGLDPGDTIAVAIHAITDHLHL